MSETAKIALPDPIFFSLEASRRQVNLERYRSFAAARSVPDLLACEPADAGTIRAIRYGGLDEDCGNPP